jgi:hypothetical protein
MDVNPMFVNVEDTDLLELENLDSGRFEFLPLIYDAAEAMISADRMVRWSGVERLIELQAGRVSPLVGYLLATRLEEPDLELRAMVVKALARILDKDDQGHLPKTAVYQSVVGFMSRIRTRTVFSILQAVDFDPSIEPMAVKLLSNCSFAGTHLADIMANRNAPMAIRKQAVHFIGRIGYLDALASLERQATRMESRRIGNNGFSSDNSDGDDEADLLAVMKETLDMLRMP